VRDRGSAVAVRIRNHVRLQQGEVREAAPVEWNLPHGAFADEIGQLRRNRVDLGRAGADRNLLGNRAEFQGQVHHRCLGDRQHHAFANNRLESLGLSPDLIAAHWHDSKGVRP
jgi:hypothetical protein